MTKQNPSSETIAQMQKQDAESFRNERARYIRMQYERGEISKVKAQAELMKGGMFPSISAMSELQ